MRSLIRLLVLTLAVFVAGNAVPSPVLAAGDKSELQQRLDALSVAYPELARAETAFSEARTAFLQLFSAEPRSWAEEFLNRTAKISTYDLQKFEGEDEYAQKHRAAFLKKRADITRYMNLAAQTAVSDPAFLILLRPVCANAAYFSMPPDYVAQTLAEYDRHKADPFSDTEHYITRKIDGIQWSAILFPGQEMGSASGGDRNMAFVVRIEGDAFSLSPIIAPVREDVYPGEKNPLRPEKYEYGPGRISINECKMEMALTVTNEEGPFAFRADARQLFANRGLSYTCEPKCSGFTYAWNESTKSFIMDDGVCREGDAWKPKSPFDEDNTLIPVAEYIQELAADNNAVSAHGKRVEDAVAAYLAAFDGKALELARSFTDGWLLDRQFPLYRLVGQKKEFIAAYVGNDAPVLNYLERMASLIQKPDARLALLLEDFASRLAWKENRKNEKNRYSRDDERYPSISDLLQTKAKPTWFAAYAAKQTSLLAVPEKTGRYAYTASGLEGGEEIVFSYDGRQFHRDGEEVKNTYLMRTAPDGAFWGYADIRVGKRADEYSYGSSYETVLQPARRQVFRIADGKMGFVLPPLPKQEEFFSKPELGHYGEILWKAPGAKRAEHLCSMAPAFEVNTASAPFAITAKDVMLEKGYGYICVPECSIPYAWDGAAYVRGEPECLPEGEWGAKQTKGRGY